MGLTAVLPAGLALAAGLLAARLQHRVEPAVVAIGLSAVAAVTVAGVVGAVAMVALVFLGDTSWLAERLAWCLTVGGEHRVPTGLGAVALAALAAMVVSGAGRLRVLRATASAGDEQAVVILPTRRPTAYAVPGRPGHVVVSQGMLRSLDADERRVLFAHKLAHLRRDHHRYIWLCDVAVAALPVLRPLRRAVRLSTERWADEEAAAEIGDRRLVARAICRAALAQHGEGGAPRLAMAGPDVSRRVEALLERPGRAGRGGRVGLLSGAAMLGVAVVASSLQLHHLTVLAPHLCSGHGA